MRKIFLILTLTLCTTLLFVSCTKGDTSKSKPNNISTNGEIEKAEGENKEELSKEIKVGDVISTDIAEITINKIEFSYDVLPDDVSGFYSHYAAESGKVYIHIDTDVKNIQKQNLKCDDIMTVQADYNNGYTYNGAAIPEDSKIGFTYANITSIDPLETLGVRFLIECPQEVEETTNPLTLNFNIAGQEYSYKMR